VLESDGTISIGASDGSWSVEQAIGIEDVGDRGDLYTHSPFGSVRADHRFLRARLIHAGPLRGELETRWRIVVPSGADRRLAGARTETRGAGFVDLRIRLRLDAASPFLRVVVDGVNGATSHRLRVRFRTGIVSPRVIADAAFGPVERAAIEVSDEDRRMETPPSTAPLHRYVSLYGAERGLTLYSDGLAEYEATPGGDVTVTLVRAVGDLSRNDLPERPGHAGWPMPTPEAQMPGPFGGEFALFPHGAASVVTVDLVEHTADDVLLPLVGTTLRSAVANHGPTPALELEGRGLTFSAAKESDDGEWLVLRCVNATDEPTEGRWHLPFEPSQAVMARLDETPHSTLTPSGRTVRFTAGAGAVVTLLVR
jgi:mannosylglycerate hydrolase